MWIERRRRDGGGGGQLSRVGSAWRLLSTLRLNYIVVYPSCALVGRTGRADGAEKGHWLPWCSPTGCIMAPGAARHTVHAHCATWKHLTVLLLRFAVIQLQTYIIHGCCALSAQRCMASWLHARELQFRLCTLDQWLQGTGTPYTVYSVYTWTQQLTIATAANCHIKANCTRTDSDVKTTLHTLSWFFYDDCRLTSSVMKSSACQHFDILNCDVYRDVGM